MFHDACTKSPPRYAVPSLPTATARTSPSNASTCPPTPPPTPGATASPDAFAIATAPVTVSVTATCRDTTPGALEAMVTVRAEGEELALLESAKAELPTLFIVSKVALERGASSAGVAPAPGTKCERCWGFHEDVGSSPAHPTICAKCAAALS